jgi:NTP pyrophosphatase (non-canonical NTP hydrolase)
MSLTFDELRKANVERCEQSFHPVNEWSPSDWANAMAGEVGEVCNLVKKLRRLGATPESIPHADSPSGQLILSRARVDIGRELADVVIYADLLAARLGISLEGAVTQKFNEVSDRVGSKVLINEDDD